MTALCSRASPAFLAQLLLHFNDDYQCLKPTSPISAARSYDAEFLPVSFTGTMCATTCINFLRGVLTTKKPKKPDKIERGRAPLYQSQSEHSSASRSKLQQLSKIYWQYDFKVIRLSATMHLQLLLVSALPGISAAPAPVVVRHGDAITLS